MRWEILDKDEKLTRLFKSEVSHTEVCLSASTWDHNNNIIKVMRRMVRLMIVVRGIMFCLR